MRISQGTFSFLPDLSDDQIRAQAEYCLAQGWALSIEHTDDPHPRNTYWEMFGQPMFDLRDAAGVMSALQAARSTFPERYIKINAFDASRGIESLRLSFIVHRPRHEAAFDPYLLAHRYRHLLPQADAPLPLKSCQLSAFSYYFFANPGCQQI